jgi:hypothetical protein
MFSTLKQGLFATAALTIAAVAATLTWHTLAHGSAGALQEADAPERPPADTVARENEQLRAQLRSLQQEVDQLKATATRESPPAVAEEESASPAPEPTAAGPAFFDDAHAAMPEGVDWKLAGEAVNEMGPLLARLIETMNETGEMPLELLAQIQSLNSKLVAQIPAMTKSGLPGTGPNGVFTHPLVTSNVLAATLDAAGQSMDASQRNKIAGLVDAFSVENRAVADSVQDLDLERVLQEADAKDRFYKEVGSLLTPAQYAVMFPDGAQGYGGASLFDSSLMTSTLARPVAAANAAEFARTVSFRAGEMLELDAAAAEQVRAIIEQVSASSPDLWSGPAQKAETTLHMIRRGRTTAAMRNQLTMMREILRQVPLTPAQRKKLVSMKGVFVPMPK